jgi:flagellar motor switch protein FliN/FliY
MADNDDINVEPEDTVPEAAQRDPGGVEGSKFEDDPNGALALDDLGVTGDTSDTGESTENLLSIEEEIEPMHNAKDLDAVYDIPVQLSAVLGKASMQVSQLLKLGRGAVVELDRKVGEAIDIYVNNRLVARGEVVVVEERLGVTMTEIIKSDRNN